MWNESLVVWIFLAVLALLLGLIGVMFSSILRQGDERRRLILQSAGSTSFATLAGMLLLQVVAGVVGSLAGTGRIEPQNPLVLLMTAAVVYCASLAYYKKKFGD